MYTLDIKTRNRKVKKISYIQTLMKDYILQYTRYSIIPAQLKQVIFSDCKIKTARIKYE